LDNSRLVELSKKPNTATREEIAEIKELSNSYSYSAFLKILIARIDNARNGKNKNKKITTAAIYTSNRGNLKSLLTKDLDKPSPSAGKKEKKRKVSKSEIKDGAPPESIHKIEKKEVISKKETTPHPKIEKTVKKVIQKKDLASAEGKEDKIKETSEFQEKNITKTSSSSKSSKLEEVKKNIKLEESKIKEDATDDANKVKSEPPVVEPVQDDNKESADSKEKFTENSDSATLDEEQTKDIPKATLADVSKEVNKDESAPDESTRTAKDNLIQDVLNNINVLKKNKEILFNLLSADKDKKPKPAKKKSDSDARTDKVIEKTTEDRQSDNVIKEEIVDIEEKQKSYEEEDPEVIKGFLDKLEENNPPPKRKLKKKEQVELIERFISSDHRIKNIKPLEEVHKKEDLSLHSVKFRDDIISENLAIIMIKQGKLEKAIDIYKKLIWKFPQKKTYFATQIEELKKSGN